MVGASLGRYVLRVLLGVVIAAVAGIAAFVVLGFVQTGSSVLILNEIDVVGIFAIGVSIPIVAISVMLIRIATAMSMSDRSFRIALFVLPCLTSCIFWAAWLVKLKKRDFSVDLLIRDWPTFLLALAMGLAFAVYWDRSGRKRA